MRSSARGLRTNASLSGFTDDLGAGFAAAAEQNKVAFAITTLQRTWQVKLTLGMNLVQTLPFKKFLFVAVVIFDGDEDLYNWIGERFAYAVDCKHLRVFRSAEPLKYFHASVCKNTAHVAAATCVDNPQRLTVVNLDADNIVTEQFVRDLIIRASQTTQPPSTPVTLPTSTKKRLDWTGTVRYRSACQGTTGRIATNMGLFLAIRGKRPG